MVGNIIRRPVLITFTVDGLIALNGKGDFLIFCKRKVHVQVYTSKGDLITDVENGKEKQVIEDMMERAQIDEQCPFDTDN